MQYKPQHNMHNSSRIHFKEYKQKEALSINVIQCVNCGQMKFSGNKCTHYNDDVWLVGDSQI